MERQPTVDRTALRLGPRSQERPADAGWTLVGGIDDPAPARVDRGGLIGPSGAGWVLDWWIGADDRWHLAAREPSVRQRRSGPGPIVVTSLRVPSGDVVATAYPVVAGGRRATAIEIANESPVPVALALAVRPVGLDGRPSPDLRLDLVDDLVITVDGEPAVLLPRPPNERVGAADADVLDRIEAGAELTWDGPVVGPLATAACVYPLPHTTSLRVTVLGPQIAPGAGAADDLAGLRPEVLPPPDTVARGWASVVDRAATFRFPDPGLTELAGAARARLILAAPGLGDGIEAADHRSARLLAALALGGHADECRLALARLAAGFPPRLPPDGGDDDGRPVSGAAAAALTVEAVAAAADLLPADVAESLLGPVAQLMSLVERAGEPAPIARAKAGLARLAARSGQPDAAAHLRSTIVVPADGADSPDDADGLGGPAPTLADVTALAEAAAPSGAWPPADGARPAARFLAAALGLLLEVDEPTGGGDPATIRLLPTMPTSWLGGEVEVHRAPVAGARVSFAIRWHGYRPALLWQIDPAVEGEPTPAVRLTCPGLDPDWSTEDRSGEALLAGSATELPASPEPGQSFS